MKNNGFEALSTNLDKTISEELFTNLPTIFKLFASTFYLGKDSLKKEYYWDSKENFKFPILAYYFEKDEKYVSIDDFMSLNEIISEGQISYLGDTLIRIANSNDGGGVNIFMGCGYSNSDIIYKASWDSWDEKGKLIELSDNIFDFMQNLKSSNISNINPSQLYRNWGEDFWRVREDE